MFSISFTVIGTFKVHTNPKINETLKPVPKTKTGDANRISNQDKEKITK